MVAIADSSKIFPSPRPSSSTNPTFASLQLAKGAIAAVSRLLLKRLGAQVSSLHALISLAPSAITCKSERSSHRPARSAARDHPRRGNTALRGAKMLAAC